MNSSNAGDSISKLEVTNVSVHGIWVLYHERELFMSYDDFPWFKDKPIASIRKVKEFSEGCFNWPELDVDLTEEMIEHPERFPLKAKSR